MKIILFILSLLMVPLCLAEDISNSVRSGQASAESAEGGYLDIGLGVGFFSSPIYAYPHNNKPDSATYEPLVYVNINGRYQYKNFFVEAYSEGIYAFNLGYKVWHNRDWSVDIIGSQVHADVGDEEEHWQETGLNVREADFNLGIRLNYYQPRYVLQFNLLRDISDTHNGFIASVLAGKSWQVRNTNLHLLSGLSYKSQAVGNYYLGISEKEAQQSDQFDAYQAGAGGEFNFEAGVTYPVNENWVLRGFYRYTQFLSGVRNSPLLIRTEGQILATSISYVF